MPRTKKIYSEELRNKVADLYANSNMTIQEIADELDLSSRSEVSRIAVNDMGCEPRKHSNITKTCGHCKRKTKLSDIKYCPYCGKLILNKKEQLIEKLNSINKYYPGLKSSDKDEIRDVILETINYLKKEVK